MLTIYGQQHASATESPPGGIILKDRLIGTGAGWRCRSCSRQRHFLASQIAQGDHHDLPAGGPPHQEMFDSNWMRLRKIRGEFKPIKTKFPGSRLRTHAPACGMMDKLIPIRTIGWRG